MFLRTLSLLLAGLVLATPSGITAQGTAALTGTVSAAGQAVGNAVVWIEGASAAATRRPRAVLHQRSLKFAPQVLAVRTGTTVDFPNDDRVFHNVFSFRDGKKFDLGIYPVGATRQVTFSEPGVSRLFCNIHPNMAGYVVAVDSPWYATSDADGRFAIPDIDAGSYTWKAWRASGTIIGGSVTVRPGAVLEVAWP
ncbi:MAG TPA: plastocyanin/azurin family copper-binding protein [Luteitalea sp.]|nr:plastocyanin/azurin family copper-binding protein [Luteitalea sp.]